MSALDGMLHPIDLRGDVRAGLLDMLRHIPRGAVVYDIGCGRKPFAEAVTALGCRYVGVDLADGFYGSETVDLIGSAYSVPIDDGAADAVISAQVLEHLQHPEAALREAHRILKEGGVMLISFPFLYPIHAPPHDYLRYTRFYFDNAADDAGFDVVERREISGYWYVTGMNAGLYMQAFDRGRLRKTGLPRLAIAAVQWMCRGMHGLEGMALSALGRDAAEFRRVWPVNYVYVLRKRVR